VGSRYLDLDKIRAKVPSVRTTSLMAITRMLTMNLFQSSTDDEPTSEIDEEDTTILMYTAGTTGKPKE
jgi:acyl-coenzyme A synthetase/AMP-(fatty) acid ligase